MCRHYSNKILRDAVRFSTEPDRETPEHNLLAAILERGIRDVRSKTADTYLSEQARNWIQSDERLAFTFIWCCEHLNIDPDVLIARLAVKEIVIPAGRRAKPTRIEREMKKLLRG